MKKMKYDLYLAGPWEKYAPEPYKTLIKNAYPYKDIYDPEMHQPNDWFETNYEAIKNSERMVAFACPLPFPGNAVELGMFYTYKREMGLYTPDKVITIWRDDIQPIFGKEVISRFPSHIVKNTHEAISLLDSFFLLK